MPELDADLAVLEASGLVVEEVGAVQAEHQPWSTSAARRNP